MRVFIALDVNEELRKISEESISKLSNTGFKANWTKPENVHITLFFLGEMNEEQVESMAHHLNKRMLGFPSFVISSKGIGYFKFKNVPRVIFIKLEATKAMQKMYLEMKSELDKHRFKYDDQGNFVPHITLGRMKESPVNWEELLQGVEIPETQLVVDSFTIYSSTLTPQGPIYKWIYKSKFEGGLMKNER